TVKDRLDLRVEILSDGLDVATLGDLHESLLDRTVSLDVGPLGSSRGQTGVVGGSSGSLSDLVIRQRVRGAGQARDHAGLGQNRLVLVREQDLQRVIREVRVSRLGGDGDVRTASEYASGRTGLLTRQREDVKVVRKFRAALDVGAITIDV